MPGAQYNLGVMYDQGDGVTEDHAEALRWYRLAAEQGHAEAQFNLGVMYAKKGCRKMMLKPCAGTKWPPSRDMPRAHHPHLGVHV